MEKITYKTAVAFCLENTPEMPAEIRERMEALLESLNKKSSSKKMTPKQEENERMKNEIAAFMGEHDIAFTISDLIKIIPGYRDLSVNKVSSLVRALVKDGRANRFERKSKAYFCSSNVAVTDETKVYAEPKADESEEG